MKTRHRTGELPESPLRNGNRIATGPDKHYLYRAAVVRWVDSLFYEPGDSRRSHLRGYALLLHKLCGIGENTFRNYCCYPEEELAGYELPPDLKDLLKLYVVLHKSLPETEVAHYLHELTRITSRGVESARGKAIRITADTLLESLHTNQEEAPTGKR